MYKHTKASSQEPANGQNSRKQTNKNCNKNSNLQLQNTSSKQMEFKIYASINVVYCVLKIYYSLLIEQWLFYVMHKFNNVDDITTLYIYNFF